MRSTLDPTLDIVFKMLFGAPAGHDSLVALLNAVLRPASRIRRVEVLNPDPGREQVQDKGVVLDLLVALDGGARVDVEVQTYRDPTLRRRALLYWSKLHAAQLARGQPYTQTRRTISIVFLNARELAGQRWHSTFRLREVHDASEWSDELELHLIELPKRPLGADAGEDRELLCWAQFLGARSDEEVKEACMASRDVARANDLLENLSASPNAQELARRREMALVTDSMRLAASRQEGQSEGRAEGRVVGRAEGHAAGMADATIRILTLRFGPISEPVAQRVRGASADQLARWLDAALEAPSLEALLAR